MRSLVLVLVTVLGACRAPMPMQVTPAFVTSPALVTRNPSDIAVLPVEDATTDATASKLLEYMRSALARRLPDRLYNPLSTRIVDASLRSSAPDPGQSILHPEYLRQAAGRAAEDALLALRVEKWDEGHLLADKYVTFQFQAALVANDGEMLWSGTLSGQVKAGGMGPSPRDREAMARSCADSAIAELLNHLQRRTP